MRFLYCSLAGDETIELSGDSFAHLKAQRKRGGEIIRLQNLRENIAYFYEISEIKRNSAKLVFAKSEELLAQNFWLKIGWAVCENAVIEKSLPFLNELGVGELLLFYADFSQKNVKLDFARFERILASSCEQCGRNLAMSVRVCELSEIENAVLLDFGGDDFSTLGGDEILLIGAEGGWSDAERAKFKRKIGLKSSCVLRAQTAIISAAAKILA